MLLEASLPNDIAGCISTRLVLLSAGGLHIKKNILYLDYSTIDNIQLKNMFEPVPTLHRGYK